MSADQIAAIRPAIVEAAEGAAGMCATFEVEGDAGRWVQFMDNTVNAAYPCSTDPSERVKDLPPIAGMKLQEWEPQMFATFEIPPSDPGAIARWIDGYFTAVLGCPADYDVDVTLEQM
jgi:hypothetical protein